MTSPHIELRMEGLEAVNAERYETLIGKSVRAAVSSAKLEYEEGAELSFLLANDSEVQNLNKQWRGKDKPTNVLSFPAEDIAVGDRAGIFIGDIAISLETVSREAALENKPMDDHFCHLVIHGLLHLFGYDHETDTDADNMELLETAILETMGIANPYESFEQQ